VTAGGFRAGRHCGVAPKLVLAVDRGERRAPSDERRVCREAIRSKRASAPPLPANGAHPNARTKELVLPIAINRS